MSRRPRNRNKTKRKRSSFHDIPWKQLTNQFAPLEICTAEQVAQIHEATLDILENIGIDFFDAEALSILEKHLALFCWRTVLHLTNNWSEMLEAP